MNAGTFGARRERLARQMGSGIIVMMGATGSPMNYAGNPLPFVQDGSFRYFFRSNRPDLIGLIDVDEGVSTLAGQDADLNDIIWTGDPGSVAAEAAQADVDRSVDCDGARQIVAAAQAAGRPIHILPAYQDAIGLRLADLLDVDPRAVGPLASLDLIAAIVALREIKSAEEIATIEATLADTVAMHRVAIACARPGMFEREIVAAMSAVAIGRGLAFAYQPICTTQGQILHNNFYGRRLSDGDLVLNDTGLSGAEGYATDITRTFPAGRRFSPLQRDIYQAVLAAQQVAIDLCAVGRPYRDVHLAACRTLVEGLIGVGIYRGDPADAVAAGAHSLFFQCGTGHQIGLDVHDMEALGEDHVGYDARYRRSPDFGLSSLRLAKPLRAGMTVTVEPGFYAIPMLIDRWAGERRHPDFIDYDMIERHRLAAFGGIRIEDMVHVTEAGPRLLGTGLPRTLSEIEQLCADR